jgi:hypothetical protein
LYNVFLNRCCPVSKKRLPKFYKKINFLKMYFLACAVSIS